MPQRLFHVFVRQHQNDAFTIASLTHPDYAAYGADLASARRELALVLAGELALGAIKPKERTHLGPLTRRVITVSLRVVQHEQLVELPLRVTALSARMDDAADTFGVWLPRLDAHFVIRTEASIVPWAEEIVRGRFHLADLDEVRAHEHDRGERADELLVSWSPSDGRRLLRARGPDPAHALGENDDEDEEAKKKPEEDMVLGGVGSDLGVRARRGELARCYLREAELERLGRVLGTRESVLLVGPSGTGKTALVHELAHQPERRIWHVPPGRLMAGAIFLGQWQERALEVVKAARAAGAVLYLDDLGALVASTEGAGETGLTLPRLLEPFARQREVTLLIEATPDALSRAEQREPAFVAALRRLPLAPMDTQRSLTVLGRIARQRAAEHKSAIPDPALATALDLIARFGDAEGLPGSGVPLVEQLARRPGKTATHADVIEAFATQTGFPRALVDPDAPLDRDAVCAHLGARVVGQEPAIARLADVVTVLKAGLADPGRPIASFLFMGPTGVGKTESALTLAEYLFGDRARLVRLDMSEYAQPFSASRLVDGRGGEGDLTRAVRRQPFTIVLLDEIEKAAPEVFDVLLQVLGEGRLTDATGRTVRFAHTLIILTSNLGAADRGRLGIRAHDAATGPDYLGAAARFFRPELLNRIDHVVPFSPLGPVAIRAIAARLLDAALAREGLRRRGIEVRVDPDVLAHLATIGFDPLLGARPMKRAIEARVLAPLAAALAGGAPPGTLRVALRDETIEVRPA